MAPSIVYDLRARWIILPIVYTLDRASGVFRSWEGGQHEFIQWSLTQRGFAPLATRVALNYNNFFTSLTHTLGTNIVLL